MIMRPLIATRVVQTTARSFPVIAGLSDVISFTTRTGTQEGIRTHLFRVETHRELASWVKVNFLNSLRVNFTITYINSVLKINRITYARYYYKYIVNICLATGWASCISDNPIYD